MVPAGGLTRVKVKLATMSFLGGIWLLGWWKRGYDIYPDAHYWCSYLPLLLYIVCTQVMSLGTGPADRYFLNHYLRHRVPSN